MKKILNELKETPMTLNEIADSMNIEKEKIYNSYLVNDSLLAHTKELGKDRNLKWTIPGSSYSNDIFQKSSYKNWLKNIEKNYVDIHSIIKDNPGIQNHQILMILTEAKNKDIERCDFKEVLSQLSHDNMIRISEEKLDNNSLDYDNKSNRLLRNTYKKEKLSWEINKNF